MDAVCVWLSAVLELLKVDLNPQVKIKLCAINCLKLYCYLYFHNVHPKPWRDYTDTVHTYKHMHTYYVCVCTSSHGNKAWQGQAHMK